MSPLPLPLPDFSVDHDTPDICAICHAPATKRYTVDNDGRTVEAKLCDKHNPGPKPAAKPRKSKADSGQMELF